MDVLTRRPRALPLVTCVTCVTLRATQKTFVLYARILSGIIAWYTAVTLQVRI